MRNTAVAAVAALASVWGSLPAFAQSSLAGDTFRISRAPGSIAVDGDLGDEGWRNATRVEKWYEINPGDNVEPPVRTVGYLTYDDRFLYVAFEFDDPNPSAIRAPLGDHDSLNGASDDFGGVFVDSLGTGHTATEFFVNANNVQFDAVIDDGSGNENAAPDFFWDSATRITERGWTLEIRIPFSSLRYKSIDPQTWGIILFRNYPRQYRYQITSTRFPRDGNCVVCRENRLVGLEHLPSGGHLVTAPYVSASQGAHAANDVLGTPLVNGALKGRAGLDLKYTPNADNAVDLALKPDFSQVEADTAQISANERFALFYPEKRPFFLEGVDLFQTPVQAVYTRTITSATLGGRLTGKEAGIRYTALVAEDAGGGSAILPAANDSSFALQAFGSTVFLGRAKRDIGLSSIGALVTDREAHDGNGHNRVVGPDFQWRPSGGDVVAAQLLFSESRTPNRPDLADEWNGQRLTGHALITTWSHNLTHLDWFTLYKDLSNGFRADAGFVPQVGVRELFGFAGWTVRPKNFLSRQRTFLDMDYIVDRSGVVVERFVQPGLGMDTKGNGFIQFRYFDDWARARDVLIERKQFAYFVQFSPTRAIKRLAADGALGQDIDFANERPGRGSTLNFSATLQPTEHLELQLLENTRLLHVDDSLGASRHLFTQRVSRVKGTYTFTSRMFVRVIAQYVSTVRDPSLYIDTVNAQSGDFGGSALFAYKINWQSVMFVGYGDSRQLSDQRQLEPLDRQFFVKLSYAFQK
jgi:hypothetical protein